jgi:hypothetical protein
MEIVTRNQKILLGEVDRLLVRKVLSTLSYHFPEQTSVGQKCCFYVKHTQFLYKKGNNRRFGGSK